MGRYFTDEVIDAVIKIWEETHPGAIERAHDVMRHPFRDNEEAMANNGTELHNLVHSISFLKEFSKQKPNFDFEIHFDVSCRLGDMLGPIGTYDVED